MRSCPWSRRERSIAGGVAVADRASRREQTRSALCRPGGPLWYQDAIAGVQDAVALAVAVGLHERFHPDPVALGDRIERIAAPDDVGDGLRGSRGRDGGRLAWRLDSGSRRIGWLVLFVEVV